MKIMKITKYKDIKDIKNFTGCCEYANGNKFWYKNSKLHRLDGPAVEWYDGSKSWYLNNKIYTKQGYYKELFKLGKITEEELFLALL